MGLFDSDSGFNDARKALARNVQMYDQIGLPEYSQFNPDLYTNQSANYELTSDDPALKSKQLEALSQLGMLSNEGLSDADKAGFSEARSLGDQMAKSKTESILQDAQEKGDAGSGMEYALREQAGQDAAERAHQMALQQEATRAQQRNQYLQAYAGQLGQQQQQQTGLNAANTNVINQFNQANTANRNATNNANTGLKNSAFQYNEGLKDKNYQNQLSKADRIAGFNSQAGQIGAAESAANQAQTNAMIGLGATAIGGIGGLASAYAAKQATKKNPEAF